MYFSNSSQNDNILTTIDVSKYRNEQYSFFLSVVSLVNTWTILVVIYLRRYVLSIIYLAGVFHSFFYQLRKNMYRYVYYNEYFVCLHNSFIFIHMMRPIFAVKPSTSYCTLCSGKYGIKTLLTIIWVSRMVLDINACKIDFQKLLIGWIGCWWQSYKRKYNNISRKVNNPVSHYSRWILKLLIQIWKWGRQDRLAKQST